MLCWSNTSASDVASPTNDLWRRVNIDFADTRHHRQLLTTTTIHTLLTNPQHAGTPCTCNSCPSFSALRSTLPCHDILGGTSLFATAEEFGERNNIPTTNGLIFLEHSFPDISRYHFLA
jgi:hypothetical protein